MISAYQKEQIEAISMVRDCLAELPLSEIEYLKSLSSDYLSFRNETRRFLSTYFGSVCNQKCYQNNLSACCSKEGIITFFADTVINGLHSSEDEIAALLAVLQQPNTGTKCVYLGEKGCLWNIKPIVCEMFICEPARKQVFMEQPEVEGRLKELERQRKTFTWPDQPVLFDKLEQYFIDAGYSSPLMYLHNSPGLLRIKKKAGI